MASFLIRFLTAFLFTSTSWPFPGTGRRLGVVMPPVFVQEAETAAWNSSPATKSTSSFGVKAGDVLVAYAGQENGAGSMTISGGSLTWTKNQEFNGDGGNCSATIWTAVVDTDKTMSVTFGSSTSVHYGGNVLTFRRSEGLGSSNKAQDDDVLPSVNITTTKANSAIAVFSCDWNATDGTSRAWKNNAGAFTELSYNFEANIYTIYGGYHANAGAAGTYAVGLNAPNSQKFSIVAMEIKGL